MSSQSSSVSNKFRAEPFVNLTAQSIEGPGSTSGSGSSRRPSSVSVAAAGDGPGSFAMHDAERDELLEDDEDALVEHRRRSSTARSRVPSIGSGRLSTSTSGVPSGLSASDVQRASIASTSSTTSSARRSSYDPNEPGVLERIHTGQGKSKRKPISVQQWKHMNTFKIRPPTPAEAAAASLPPAPLSIDPRQPYPPSIAPDQNMQMETDTAAPGGSAFVFIPEGGSSNAVPAPPPIARPVPIVRPPPSIVNTSSAASTAKPPRKRAKREEPDDQSVQVFYYEDPGSKSPSIPRRPSNDIPLSPTRRDSVGLSQPIAPDSTSDIQIPTPAIVTPLSPPPSLVAPVAIAPSQTLTTPAIVTPTHRTVKYDPIERIFTLPEPDILDKGGRPPKRWTSASQKAYTIGGRQWETNTWRTSGEPAVPMKPPQGFGRAAPSSNAGLPTSEGSNGGLHGLSTLALAMNAAKETPSSSLTPGAGIGSSAAKRIKKVKSDASIGSGATPVGGVGAKKKPGTAAASGLGATGKKGKKTTVDAATLSSQGPTPAIPTVTDGDTEMKEG